MPSEFDIAFDRARRAMAEGFADVALVPATEAVKLAPERWDARLLLARVWLGIGGPARATADARAALELGASGGMPDGERWLAHDVIARAALREGDRETAEASLRVVCEDPAAEAARVRLIALLVDVDRGSDARDTAPSLLSGGALEDRANALAWALAGTDGRGAPCSSPDVQCALAELEAAAGLNEEARRRFQREFQRDPTSERAAAGLRGLIADEKKKSRAERPWDAFDWTFAFLGFRFVMISLNFAIALGLAYWMMAGRPRLTGRFGGVQTNLVLAAACTLVFVVGFFALARARRRKATRQGMSGTPPKPDSPEQPIPSTE